MKYEIYERPRPRKRGKKDALKFKLKEKMKYKVYERPRKRSRPSASRKGVT